MRKKKIVYLLLIAIVIVVIFRVLSCYYRQYKLFNDIKQYCHDNNISFVGTRLFYCIDNIIKIKAEFSNHAEAQIYISTTCIPLTEELFNRAVKWKYCRPPENYLLVDFGNESCSVINFQAYEKLPQGINSSLQIIIMYQLDKTVVFIKDDVNKPAQIGTYKKDIIELAKFIEGEI